MGSVVELSSIVKLAPNNWRVDFVIVLVNAVNDSVTDPRLQ